ncbi:unnamed protein product, partial [Scytosiphon promiscuus]
MLQHLWRVQRPAGFVFRAEQQVPPGAVRRHRGCCRCHRQARVRLGGARSRAGASLFVDQREHAPPRLRRPRFRCRRERTRERPCDDRNSNLSRRRQRQRQRRCATPGRGGGGDGG